VVVIFIKSAYAFTVNEEHLQLLALVLSL
jgi:hypothetical protein